MSVASQHRPGWAPSTPAARVTPEQMLAQVNGREPLDGTECGATSTLGGSLFVCANPLDHADERVHGIKACGHRYVHAVKGGLEDDQ